MLPSGPLSYPSQSIERSRLSCQKPPSPVTWTKFPTTSLALHRDEKSPCLLSIPAMSSIEKQCCPRDVRPCYFLSYVDVDTAPWRAFRIRSPGYELLRNMDTLLLCTLKPLERCHKSRSLHVDSTSVQSGSFEDITRDISPANPSGSNRICSARIPQSFSDAKTCVKQ